MASFHPKFFILLTFTVFSLTPAHVIHKHHGERGTELMKRKVDELLKNIKRSSNAVFDSPCIVDGREYQHGEDIDTQDPCESCFCRVSILHMFDYFYIVVTYVCYNWDKR